MGHTHTHTHTHTQFIDPLHPVFDSIEEIRKKLDIEIKASQCSLLGVGDNHRVRASAHANGLKIDGRIEMVKADLKAKAVADQKRCGPHVARVLAMTKSCCSVNENCLGVGCHLPINLLFFHKVLSVTVQADGVFKQDSDCTEGISALADEFQIKLGVMIDGQELFKNPPAWKIKNKVAELLGSEDKAEVGLGSIEFFEKYTLGAFLILEEHR